MFRALFPPIWPSRSGRHAPSASTRKAGWRPQVEALESRLTPSCRVDWGNPTWIDCTNDINVDFIDLYKLGGGTYVFINGSYWGYTTAPTIDVNGHGGVYAERVTLMDLDSGPHNYHVRPTWISIPTSRFYTVYYNDTVQRVELDTGGGGDQVWVGTAAHTLDGIRHVTLRGGAGSNYNSLSINDFNYAGGDTYTVAANSVRVAGLPSLVVNYSGFHQLSLNAGDGADLVRITSSSTVTTSVFAGGGNDIVVGDYRANRLEGGPGDDLLIGGTGSDVVVGGDGADVLVAGQTHHDQQPSRLRMIMAEWSRPTPYLLRSIRLHDLAGGLNDPFFLNEDTVMEWEGTRNVLFGQAGMDLFYPGCSADTTDAVHGTPYGIWDEFEFGSACAPSGPSAGDPPLGAADDLRAAVPALGRGTASALATVVFLPDHPSGADPAAPDQVQEPVSTAPGANILASDLVMPAAKKDHALAHSLPPGPDQYAFAKWVQWTDLLAALEV